MRRIKSVSLSIPSVVGSFTSINCTLTLQRSTLRVSPSLNSGVYARDTTQDDTRFVDYFGGAESSSPAGGQRQRHVRLNLDQSRFFRLREPGQ